MTDEPEMLYELKDGTRCLSAGLLGAAHCIPELLGEERLLEIERRILAIEERLKVIEQ